MFFKFQNKTTKKRQDKKDGKNSERDRLKFDSTFDDVIVMSYGYENIFFVCDNRELAIIHKLCP